LGSLFGPIDAIHCWVRYHFHVSLGFGLALAACVVEDRHAAAVDTVVRVDTLSLVDTVRVVDTVVALGVIDTDTSLPSSPIELSEHADDLLYLRARRLIVPVPGVRAVDVPDTYHEMRGGTRRHEAVDIPAPRGTPVLSTDDGRVVKLHTSADGGLMVYTEDPSRHYVYYYAHLDRYRPGLAEAQPVAKGDTIGFVGTTGNAPPNLPHLHFGIGRMDSTRRWWKVIPLDPRPILIASEEMRGFAALRAGSVSGSVRRPSPAGGRSPR
jgi:murein DD-endopeptidase MepM/ murein hydrolase activator NlpD